jgi:hypothetical protein
VVQRVDIPKFKFTEMLQMPSDPVCSYDDLAVTSGNIKLFNLPLWACGTSTVITYPDIVLDGMSISCFNTPQFLFNYFHSNILSYLPTEQDKIQLRKYFSKYTFCPSDHGLPKLPKSPLTPNTHEEVIKQKPKTISPETKVAEIVLIDNEVTNEDLRTMYEFGTCEDEDISTLEDLNFGESMDQDEMNDLLGFDMSSLYLQYEEDEDQEPDPIPANQENFMFDEKSFHQAFQFNPLEIKLETPMQEDTVEDLNFGESMDQNDMFDLLGFDMGSLFREENADEAQVEDKGYLATTGDFMFDEETLRNALHFTPGEIVLEDQVDEKISDGVQFEFQPGNIELLSVSKPRKVYTDKPIPIVHVDSDYQHIAWSDFITNDEVEGNRQNLADFVFDEDSFEEESDEMSIPEEDEELEDFVYQGKSYLQLSKPSYAHITSFAIKTVEDLDSLEVFMMRNWTGFEEGLWANDPNMQFKIIRLLYEIYCSNSNWLDIDSKLILDYSYFEVQHYLGLGQCGTKAKIQQGEIEFEGFKLKFKTQKTFNKEHFANVYKMKNPEKNVTISQQKDVKFLCSVNTPITQDFLRNEKISLPEFKNILFETLRDVADLLDVLV